MRSFALLLLGTFIGHAGHAQNYISHLGALTALEQQASVSEGGSAPNMVSVMPDHLSQMQEDRLELADSGSHDHATASVAYLSLREKESLYFSFSSSAVTHDGEEHHGNGPDENQGNDHFGHGFHGSVIPEPVSYATFLGLAALGLSVWRRRVSLR